MGAGSPAKGLSTHLFYVRTQLAKLPVARLSVLHEGNLNSLLHPQADHGTEQEAALILQNGQLSSEIGNGQSVTLFSASNTPLAERSAETTLLAENSQSSIVNSSSRNSRKYLSYTAYGHGQTDLILGYTGQRYDRLTNCYHLGNGYRAFSPQIMRFLSPDSLSPFRNRTLNAYAYCMGDPINRHDPSGHTWKALKAWITQAGTAVRTFSKTGARLSRRSHRSN